MSFAVVFTFLCLVLPSFSFIPLPLPAPVKQQRFGAGQSDEADQFVPGISSEELRSMEKASQRLSAEETTMKSRFLSGDDLQSLRREVLNLSEERRELLTTNSNPGRVSELEQAILQAQQADAEYVYHISKQHAEAAEAAGKTERARGFRREASRARAELAHFKLDGLWVGKYGEQGFEMINVTYQGDTLIAYKLTGDQNVPSGEISFTVDLSPSPDTIYGNANLLQPIELNHDAAEQWGSKFLPRFNGHGQVARSGFSHAQWMDGQLILVNQYFSFAWLPIGHQVFFGRPSAELTLKLLRESRFRKFADEQARSLLTRCWEETGYIQDDMDVTDGLFKSHDQSYYYDLEGCYE